MLPPATGETRHWSVRSTLEAAVWVEGYGVERLDAGPGSSFCVPRRFAHPPSPRRQSPVSERRTPGTAGGDDSNGMSSIRRPPRITHGLPFQILADAGAIHAVEYRQAAIGVVSEVRFLLATAQS